MPRSSVRWKASSALAAASPASMRRPIPSTTGRGMAHGWAPTSGHIHRACRTPAYSPNAMAAHVARPGRYAAKFTPAATTHARAHVVATVDERLYDGGGWAMTTRSPGATPSMAATAGTPGWVMTRRCIAIQTSSRSCGRGYATRPAHRRAAEWHRAPSRAPSPRRSSRLRRPSHRPRSARRRAALPATPGSSPPRCSR